MIGKLLQKSAVRKGSSIEPIEGGVIKAVVSLIRLKTRERVKTHACCAQVITCRLVAPYKHL